MTVSPSDAVSDECIVRTASLTSAEFNDLAMGCTPLRSGVAEMSRSVEYDGVATGSSLADV